MTQGQNSNDITSVIATLAQRQGNRDKTPPMSGPKRAAILMLALGEQYGGKVWSQLDDDEVRELSLAMSTLGNVEAERRHRERQFAHLVVVELGPDLAAILLAERQHQDRGALRTAHGRRLVPIALALGEGGDDARDIVGILALCHVRSRHVAAGSLSH